MLSQGISCILYTQPSRFAFAQRAIVDFQRQRGLDPSSWQGRVAELLIVTSDEQYAARLRGFLSRSGWGWPQVLHHRSSRSEFDCLSHALTVAEGGHVVFWNDADRHSSEWLLHVKGTIGMTGATVLIPTRTLYHVYETNDTRVCDFQNHTVPLLDNAVLSNVIFPRKSLPPMTSILRADTVQKIFESAVQTHSPYCYGENFHHLCGIVGDEPTEYHHGRMNQDGVTPPIAAIDVKQVTRDLAGFNGDRDSQYSVTGSDGVAFVHHLAQERAYPSGLLPIKAETFPNQEAGSDAQQEGSG